MRLFILTLCTFACMQLTASPEKIEMHSAIEMNLLSGESALAFAPTIHEWVSHHFRSYPYLYAAKEDETVNSGDLIYGKADQAFVIAPKMGGKIAGILAAIPLDAPLLNGEYLPADMADRIKEKGFHPEKILYIGMFLIAPEYRQDKSFVCSLYDQLVKSAKERGKTEICYIEILREENHPLKPAFYLPPEPWGEMISGFKSMDITVDLTWPTLQPDGSTKDEANKLLFYIKNI